MIVSAALFLVPQAIGHHSGYGGLGIGIGLLSGYSAHTIGHQFSHHDVPIEVTTMEIGVHALAAGSIIGFVYGNTDIGLLFGLAIASHKGPAGYASVKRLIRQNLPSSTVLVPASAFGIAAISMATLDLPGNPILNALIFGFGAGIFLHVAMDFTPECEIGGEIYQISNVSTDDHMLLDRLRLHVLASMSTGALVVIGLWLLLE
ncbi:MAG: ZIP family metal transporter [Halodesulfurarchaeum sp.]